MLCSILLYLCIVMICFDFRHDTYSTSTLEFQKNILGKIVGLLSNSHVESSVPATALPSLSPPPIPYSVRLSFYLSIHFIIHPPFIHPSLLPSLPLYIIWLLEFTNYKIIIRLISTLNKLEDMMIFY